MTVQELHSKLKELQEPKGYFLNPLEPDTVAELLQGLLKNKERYGYMSCPCRLATGDIKKDRDIICPCIYREADVQEYGTCYCGLYVSSAFVEGKVPLSYVPERRHQAW